MNFSAWVRVFFLFPVLSLFMMIVAIPPAHAGGEFSKSQKSEIEMLLKEYLLREPEIVRDALIKLQVLENEKKDRQQRIAFQKKKTEIFNDSKGFVAGNKNGDVTLVMFFDYNCGYCRASFPIIEELIKSDPNLRILLREFPLLGENSAAVSRLAIASIKQKKYLEYHRALMSSKIRLDKEAALKIAIKVGIDPGKLEKEAQTPEIEGLLKETFRLSSDILLNSTPSFALGNEVLVGMIDLKELKNKIAALRKEI
ncbi:MAG: DsbA family protein [Alphaproteobacteria bacterium]|nr:DsbA family protein [Alphaproteobacteria bacterium]